MHLYLVVNPAAGRRNAVPYAESVATRLEERGHRVTRYVTKGPGDGAVHAAGLGPDACDVLGVVGGDGTLAELVDSRHDGLPWPIALVPMGTANLVARELGMPLARDATATAAALHAGIAWPIDVMALTAEGSPRRRAVANVGVGPDAEIVRTIAALRAGNQASGGYIHWVRPILDTMRRAHMTPLHIEIDGRKTFRGHACIVQNASNYGGVFALSPTAGLASGALDVVVVRGRTARDLMAIGVGGLLRRLGNNHLIKIVRGDRVRVVAATPAAVQADGDPAGTTALEVERLPAALRLWKRTANA
ncbi:MAG: diacylglycerol kinase family protein [Planctomycetota bacterium]